MAEMKAQGKSFGTAKNERQTAESSKSVETGAEKGTEKNTTQSSVMMSG
jgi:hypothetical protein